MKIKFKTVKAGLDELCVNDCREDIETVLVDIHVFVGWDCKAALHDAIRTWAKKAKAGDIFSARYTVIVAVSGP